MIGSGNTLYHMTYIDDLVEGIILAGNKHDALGKVFTIAGPQYTTIRELVNLIAEILGKPRPKLRIPFYPVYVASIVCDAACRAIKIKPPIFSIEKAKKLLGYQPRISLRDGLAATAAWYFERGLI
jgi:nucleoside-diphosphate-sugar epimerase